MVSRAVATDLAYELLAREGLLKKGWKIEISRTKRVLGQCWYSEKIIYLSIFFIHHHSLEEVREVILHEIAHALAGAKEIHGQGWKKECRRLGISPTVCYDSKIPAKYIAECVCGKRYHKFYKPRKNVGYYCTKCEKKLRWKTGE